ncbi:hypothetical protein [Komagataeibacter xylinus]|uniref:Mrr-like domain-containing protein n=1 Tax=Komagataeibacter xylinus TaxID=28448 RepID=A0A857FSX2_KOMXY|nr:hypothetical protein [Komagataeibacter xylinus]QHC37305.1 hypothetical protein FMA36_16880 [Komagataeibacter xylinus]
MIHPLKQFRPVSSWEVFESLCRDLWSKIWNDPHAKKNGRPGQKQNGVDIWGQINGRGPYLGIQCKLKDISVGSTLSKKEIETEVEKAIQFTPRLSKLIFATTAPNDAKTETIVREISNSNKNIDITIHGWDDIVNYLNIHEDIAKIYYKDSYENSFDIDNYLYDFICKELSIESFEYNANIIPFRHYGIEFEFGFISKLQAFPQNLDAFYHRIDKRHISKEMYIATNKLLEVISKINKQLNGNLVDVINSDYMKMYWVPCVGMDYHEKGEFIIEKKCELKYNLKKLFYILNFMIAYTSRKKGHFHQNFLKFVDFIDCNGGLTGDPPHSPFHIPSVGTIEELRNI